MRSPETRVASAYRFLKTQRWLLLAGACCIASIWTQARSPWPSEPSLLLAQVIAMALGLCGVVWAPQWQRRFAIPFNALIALLAVALIATASLSARASERQWPVLALGWVAFLLLVGLTLGVWKRNLGGWRRWFLWASWLLLGGIAWSWRCGVSSLLPPLLFVGVLLCFWTGRWKFGLPAAGLATLLIAWQILSHPYICARFNLNLRVLDDPVGLQYQALRVREVLGGMRLLGSKAPLHAIPNANTHCALALLARCGGWLGVICWASIQSGLLVVAFKRAWHLRGTVAGGFLAALALTLSVAILSDVFLNIGFLGKGVALPLLGLDPVLALMALGMMALIARAEPRADLAAKKEPDVAG